MLYQLLQKKYFRIGALSIGIIAVLIAIPVVANQMFDEEVIGDFKHIMTDYDEKHTPKIECPDESTPPFTSTTSTGLVSTKMT